MSEPNQTIPGFVKGFFNYLDHQQVRTAILHGWQGEFEGEISDIDFVVDQASFDKLPSLVRNWCQSQGWRLCQIFRHEPTAAYYICVSASNPLQGVALDACADYQRNGTVLITAEDLLNRRIALNWGGYRLANGTELQYRFAKAAAKSKLTEACALEFAGYSDADRAETAGWLERCWQIVLKSWEPAALEDAFEQLRKKSNDRPSLLSVSSIRRIIERVLNPTGMIVITGSDKHSGLATNLAHQLGKLYFRRAKIAEGWNISLVPDLVMSTMVILPNLTSPTRRLLPKELVLDIDPEWDIETVSHHLARRLEERCAARSF
jgi:hypothetical protein